MRIRRLTLRGRPLTEDKCHTWSDSPLVRRCESLTLCVDQRKDILVLVNDMPTLRALYLLDENIDEGLIADLQRDFQRRILVHIIHPLMIHNCSLSTPLNIDPAATMITKLSVDDFFNAEKTESSKTNEHENSSYKPSNIPEIETNKTVDLTESLSRLTQSDELLVCIELMGQQLSSNNDSRQISKYETYSVVAVFDGRRLSSSRRRRSNLWTL